MKTKEKREKRKKKEKNECGEAKIINLQLSELQIHRLKSLLEWERRSAEGNKFWILGEPSGYN
ncbi:hypothetical protein KKA09_03830 [Patescibacteria group bacterium]|nr:hypothetical protein [Patescibacteria group bacterium]